MKMTRRLAAVLALLILLVSAIAVAAHAELVDAQPAPGAELTESPAEIRLTFSEPAGAASEILLFGQGFQPVEGIVMQNDPAHPEVIYATLPVLESDTYTVQWSATSDDGHEISGTYSFTVVGEAGESGEVVHNSTGGDSAAAGSSLWTIIAIAMIGGALLLILAQRFLQGP